MTPTTTASLLAAPADAERADLAALRSALGERADAEGVTDLAYTVVDSPVGPLLLAATAAGLVRVAFAVQDHDAVLDDLASRIGPRVLRVPRRLDEAARQVEHYFDGRRQSFDLPLDLRLVTGFRRAVIEHLADVGYGRTASYAAVAGLVGRPQAVRAVGSACRVNPVPVVLPCHRVVRSDGTPGEYAGGADAKRHLLALEAVVSAQDRDPVASR